MSAVIHPFLDTSNLVSTPAILPTVFNFISPLACNTPPLHTAPACVNSILFKAVILDTYCPFPVIITLPDASIVES
ncbi:Uncharacterised protein [Clostridioides difficile]|nr:Uncharacterised protein [Clostridioides difficile]